MKRLLKPFTLVAVILMTLVISQASLMHGALAAENVTFSDVIMTVGANERERNLTWYSETKANAEVRYGKSIDGALPENYTSAKAIAVESHKIGYYAYKATMCALEENTDYVYVMVVGSTVSDPVAFRVNAFGDEFSFAFIADAQTGSATVADSWTDSLTKIKNNFSDVSFIVSAGDQTSDPALESNFGYFISEELSNVAVATTVGPPHDNTVRYREHYNLPNLSTTYGVSTASGDYFYTYNNILFMHLNVEDTSYADHVTFMENAIWENPDCAWKIVVLHYSFFTGGNHSTSSAVTNFRSNLAGEFCRLGIDVVLSGHDHIYSRSQLMIDGTTVSSDIVSDSTVTDPQGTLYLCGTSAAGSSYYSVEHSDDDSYIAYRDDSDRKGAVIFELRDNALTLKAYFLDGSTPELFDTFTIQKTPDTLRLNGESEMLEVTEDGGKTYLPLINAYAYSSATIKVIDGSYALSTDGGNTYQSLNIDSENENFVLHINTTDGIWEFSTDNGASYVSTGVSTEFYTVKFVSDPDASFGDSITKYTERRYNSATPDALDLMMPVGSVAEGSVYEWHWAYYKIGGDGEEVTSFVLGDEYVAYPYSTVTLISNTLYIASASDPEDYTYTWSEIWPLIENFAGESFTLKLKEDITVSSSVSLTSPVNVTLDLVGYTLKTSDASYALRFDTGANGAALHLITSENGGTVNAGSSNFFYISSNTKSVININIGSEDTFPVTLSSAKYFVASTNNFKHVSTLKLKFVGGNYSVSRGLVEIYNISTSANQNIYEITAKDALFNFTSSAAAFAYQHAEGYCASSSSSLNATGCTFTDTSTADHTASIPLMRGDYWNGTLSFSDCDFVGVSLGASASGDPLTAPDSITVGEGCTFKNSDKSFTTETTLAFLSSKVTLADGCVVARTDADGTLAVLSKSETVAITWYGPTGFTEYWKKGLTPSYHGTTSLVSGANTFNFVVDGTPVPATEDTTYNLTTNEGYVFCIVDNTWHFSVDGGETYQPLDVEISTIGCVVIIDGVETGYSTGTSFDEILDALNISSNSGKTITIRLAEDMVKNSSGKFNQPTSYTLNVDLAGNKLTLDMGGKLQFAGDYNITIYSSLVGGEVVCTSSSDCFQVDNGGTFTFGSEEYRNTLTVTSSGYLLNVGAVTDSLLDVNYFYSTFNCGSYGILRLNAKGASVATLNAKMTGITVNGTNSVVLYNASSTLSATGNGGVYSASSLIVAQNCSFKTASSSLNFFGHKNFTDRYFGRVSFEGCTFDGYIINGDLIYSDGDLSYNTYFSTLTDYDPTKTITVGRGCLFYNSASSFDSATTGFACANASLAPNCVIVNESDCISIRCDHTYADESDKCAHCGAFRDGIASLYGYSISLNGDIAINFYLELSDEVKADTGAYLLLTMPDGEVTKILISDLRQKDGYYVASPEVPAKDIDKTVKVQVVTSAGKEGIVYERSIRTYANKIRANASDYEQKLLDLVEALVSYGEACANYFAGENDNQEFTEVTVETLSAYALCISGNLPSDLSYYGSSLLVDSKTTIRHYFCLTGGSIGAYTFTVDGVAITPVQEGSTNYYYIDIANIASDDLDCTYTVSVGEFTLEYSALSYAYSVLEKYQQTDASLCNVVCALALYNQKANYYFE